MGVKPCACHARSTVGAIVLAFGMLEFAARAGSDQRLPAAAATALGAPSLKLFMRHHAVRADRSAGPVEQCVDVPSAAHEHVMEDEKGGGPFAAR